MNRPDAETESHVSIEPKPIALLIASIGPRLGIEVHLEPVHQRVGQLITPDGRRFYFRGANVDLNTLGSTEIAKDKDWAAHFMEDLGYPVPEGKAFYSARWCKRLGSDLGQDAAFEYAQELGFPVIVKPNSKSQGMGVQKVDNREDFLAAVKLVFNVCRDPVVLVQKPVVGDDYRILVLDDEAIAAYRRTPLSVVGDGKSTIYDLVVKKQEVFIVAGRDTRINVNDTRIPIKLSSTGLCLSSVPVCGEKIELLDNANLSDGGEAHDVTDILGDSYRKMATQLTYDMGLRFCGVDIITPEPIDQPIRNYTVIEINAAPGVDYYTRVGYRQQKIVEGLYEKILLALLKNSSR